MGAKLGRQIFGAIVESNAKPQLLGKNVLFFRGVRQASHLCVSNFGDLASNRAHAPRRTL